MEKEKDENLRHQLDQELDSIRSLLFANPDPVSAALENPTPAENATTSDKTQAQDLEYDQYVRELAFDKRSKPKDRTKTEEELALEEREALEKAEKRRLRRMRGEDDEESDDEERGKRKRARGGDDLDDDFMDEDEAYDGLGAGLAQAGNDENIDDEDEESEENEEGEDEEGESDGEEDGSGSEESDDVDEGEGSEGEHADLVSTKHLKTKKQVPTSKRQELPFTFPCPSSHEDFLEIVENVDDGDVPIVVQRIRALHHPSLGADNKFKLQVRMPQLLSLRRRSCFYRPLQVFSLTTSCIWRRPLLPAFPSSPASLLTSSLSLRHTLSSPQNTSMLNSRSCRRTFGMVCHKAPIHQGQKPGLACRN